MIGSRRILALNHVMFGVNKYTHTSINATCAWLQDIDETFYKTLTSKMILSILMSIWILGR